MTTELAHYTGPTAPAVAEPNGTIARLSDWADEARAAASIATSLCKTSFVPEVFRGKPEEATAAILTGHELGLSPMASLRAIYVIKGTPAMYANTLRAVVQSQGHDIWVEESTDTRAIVAARRRGASDVERVTWTMDRAKKAGLAGNQQYQKNPQAMLVARATAEVCRRIAADALHGIPYAVEELDEQGDGGTTTEPVAKPAPRRTAKRAPVEPKQPTPAPEPDFDEPPASAEASDQGDGLDVFTPITPAQLKKLQVSLREYGITDRDAGLAYYADTIGREVASSKDLSKDEASRIIDKLEKELAKEDAEPTLDDPTLDED